MMTSGVEGVDLQESLQDAYEAAARRLVEDIFTNVRTSTNGSGKLEPDDSNTDTIEGHVPSIDDRLLNIRENLPKVNFSDCKEFLKPKQGKKSDQFQFRAGSATNSKLLTQIKELNFSAVGGLNGFPKFNKGGLNCVSGRKVTVYAERGSYVAGDSGSWAKGEHIYGEGCYPVSRGHSTITPSSFCDPNCNNNNNTNSDESKLSPRELKDLAGSYGMIGIAAGTTKPYHKEWSDVGVGFPAKACGYVQVVSTLKKHRDVELERDKVKYHYREPNVMMLHAASAALGLVGIAAGTNHGMGPWPNRCGAKRVASLFVEQYMLRLQREQFEKAWSDTFHGGQAGQTATTVPDDTNVSDNPLE